MPPFALKFLHSIGTMIRANAGVALDDHLVYLQKKLQAAGSPGDLTAVQMLGVQAVSALLVPLIWVAIILQMPSMHFLFVGPQQIFVYLLLIFVGIFFPIMNLNERAYARQKSVALALPDTLDLITITVEAGLDFATAMRRVMEKMKPSPLRDELEHFFNQLELGRSRREALRELAARVQLNDMQTVVSSLIQADRLGSSIGPVLRVQSDMLRARRAQRCEKAAQEAPVKMLLPLLSCIFPAVFIMIFGPVIIQMIQDLAR